MVHFSVGIGQYDYRSEDGGITWVRWLREVPAPHTPVVRGDVNLSSLPAQPNEFYWDFATLLPCCFGVAVGHQPMNRDASLAKIFITNDQGRHWHQKLPKARLPLLRRTIGLDSPSWPVERFASLALPTAACIALAWDDPWLLDGPQSHVICSPDRGQSFEYHCLGYTNPYLAVDYNGRLLALNDGFYFESRDGGITWGKRDFHVDWPEGYEKEQTALLRHVSFTGPNVGYALVVHWPAGLRRERPLDVGLLTTTDNGMRWRHMHVFEGPNIGDVNERHVLHLRVA